MHILYNTFSYNILLYIRHRHNWLFYYFFTHFKVMKTLLIVLFIIGISLPSFAGLQEKDVLGKWTYKVETEQGALTGFLKFENKDGQLAGQVISDDGETMKFTRVEIRDNNILYFELQPDDMVLKATLTVENNKFVGTVAAEGGEMTITGKKVE